MAVEIEKFASFMRNLRRDLHRHPETGWAEFRTTAIITDIVTKLGFKVRFAKDFINPESVMGRHIRDTNAERRRAKKHGASWETLLLMGDYTGLIAELDTGLPGPTTVFRFDIDCVSINESKDKNLHYPVREKFISLEPGKMHACAHDGHTAVGLGLASLLAERREELKGKVRLIFQPAEEGVRGGYSFAEGGAADGADLFFAMHIGLGFPTGVVCGGAEGMLCSTKFDVEFKGVAAHAGFEPHKGRNALLPAARAALDLHNIPSELDSKGLVRVNVGVLNAGEGRNVVAPNAVMVVETRGENNELAAEAYRRAEEILKAAADFYGVSMTIIKQGESNRADSDAKLARFASEVAKRAEGVTEAKDLCTLRISEDSGWMMKRVQETGGLATYMIIGADTQAGHHSETFDFDERAMSIALGVLSEIVLEVNGVNGRGLDF